MKAPDKLFLQPEVVFDAGNINGHTSNSYDTVYIRKDALIEWAKENIDSLGRLSYGEFLDKLNEM